MFITLQGKSYHEVIHDIANRGWTGRIKLNDIICTVYTPYYVTSDEPNLEVEVC